MGQPPIRLLSQDKEMRTKVFDSSREMAEAAAEAAGDLLRAAIGARGRAFLVMATGNSQLAFLAALAGQAGIDWARVTAFQLDDYIGLPRRHPAALAEFLRKNVIARVQPGEVHLLDEETPEEMSALISRQQVDVAFVGVGENGHLAFNDPPADFTTESPYLRVKLDRRCRQQQVGEGWFASIEEVPREAVSMSIRQILKSRAILCVVPERRKAEAVRDCFANAVSPLHPASILQEHDGAILFLDRESASLL